MSMLHSCCPPRAAVRVNELSAHLLYCPCTAGSEHTSVLAAPTAVSAAVIVGLRPGVLSDTDSLGLLRKLLQLAIGLPDDSASEAAAVATASLLNKWPNSKSLLMCSAEPLVTDTFTYGRWVLQALTALAGSHTLHMSVKRRSDCSLPNCFSVLHC